MVRMLGCGFVYVWGREHACVPRQLATAGGGRGSAAVHPVHQFISRRRNELFPSQSIIPVAIDHSIDYSRRIRLYPSQSIIPVAIDHSRCKRLFPSQCTLPVAIYYSRRNR